MIKGKHYSWDNIGELPDEILGYKVTSKEDMSTSCFFGELNPLSNFHHSLFIFNNHWFHSTKQFIQLKKAEFFNKRQTTLKILALDSAIECKQLARNIKIYDVNKWNEVAQHECFEGILEKFRQNPPLNKVPQDTRSKIIAENCYDRKWGTGVPLHSPEALNRELWTSENLLGKILANV